MKKQQEIKTYLTRAQELNVDPNFYLSEPYLNLCGAECFTNKGWIWIQDETWTLFPPLPLNVLAHFTPPYNLQKVWSDFFHKHPNYAHSIFLDWEYIFNSTHFNDLSGGKWEVFRKNIRKWPKRNPKWYYMEFYEKSEVANLLGDWLEEKREDVQDVGLIIEFLLNGTSLSKDIHRKFLYHDKQLVAVNVWDDNWKYINYRYCIIKKGEPYLDEFARYLFYTDLEIQIKGKLINDGGSIGNKGLEAFKDKLNPVRKREVHSWFI